MVELYQIWKWLWSLSFRIGHISVGLSCLVNAETIRPSWLIHQSNDRKRICNYFGNWLTELFLKQECKKEKKNLVFQLQLLDDSEFNIFMFLTVW